MGTNWNAGGAAWTFSWRYEFIYFFEYCMGDWALTNVAWRSCGDSLFGDLQKLPGHGPGQPALGVPAWARGWSRWPPEGPANCFGVLWALDHIWIEVVNLYLVTLVVTKYVSIKWGGNSDIHLCPRQLLHTLFFWPKLVRCLNFLKIHEAKHLGPKYHLIDISVLYWT